MFATATKNFVDEIDRGGCLIPVSSLNDSIGPLTLVVKRKRFFPWQKPKYLPTDFTLNDVLTGDKIIPVVIETDFLKYDGTFGGSIDGNMEANLVNVSLTVEGKDASKLQSPFGSLKKEEVDVQKLLCDSKDKTLDMTHCLIQQTLEKPREVFGAVKDRIVTAQPCSVIEEVQKGCQLGGVLSPCAPKITKVSVKPNSSLHKDSNVTLEIPPHTVLAYGIIELVVKSSGHFELCLMSDTHGGFEVDGPVGEGLVGVTGGGEETTPNNSRLKKELDRLNGHFQLLSALPSSTRSSLLRLLRATMKDRQTVSVLENALEQVCLGVASGGVASGGVASGGVASGGVASGGVAPGPGNVPEGSLRQTVHAVLELVGQPRPDRSPSLCSAAHLVVSALDEMTEEGLSALGSCSPKVLQALQLLVQQSVVGRGEASLGDPRLAPLAGEEGYERARQLLSSCHVVLKREGDRLQTETIAMPGDLPPLVLCVAVRGLASVGHGV